MPAPEPSSPPSVPIYSMSILSWSDRASGSLRGFVDVKMPSATSDRWSDAVIAALKYVEPAALA